jgi:hypothetical protein
MFIFNFRPILFNIPKEYFVCTAMLHQWLYLKFTASKDYCTNSWTGIWLEKITKGTSALTEEIAVYWR